MRPMALFPGFVQCFQYSAWTDRSCIPGQDGLDLYLAGRAGMDRGVSHQATGIDQGATHGDMIQAEGTGATFEPGREAVIDLSFTQGRPRRRRGRREREDDVGLGALSRQALDRAGGEQTLK